MIRELLPDRDGSLKNGVVMAEDWPTWEIVLPPLGYQVLKIYAPARFMKLLQGGKLIGAEWLPPNQASRIRNLQYSWFFVSGSPGFSRHLWGGGIDRDRKAVLMSVGYRVINFSGRHGSCKIFN